MTLYSSGQGGDEHFNDHKENTVLLLLCCCALLGIKTSNNQIRAGNEAALAHHQALAATVYISASKTTMQQFQSFDRDSIV